MSIFVSKFPQFNFKIKTKGLLLIGFVFFFLISGTSSVVLAQSREELQDELKKLEVEIENHKKVIDSKKKEGKSLERDITILDTKIKKTETEIKATDKSIKNIAYSIKEKEDNLYTLDKKINKERELIKNALKKMNTDRMDNFVVTLLSKNNFSDSIDNINSLGNLKSSLQTSVENIKTTKVVIEGVKENLIENKKETEYLKSQKIAQKEDIEENKLEKKTVLKETKGQEKVYQDLLQNTEKRAKEIRVALFSLNSSNQTINFGTAYELAKKVEAQTGVRAAFLLGIITVETNLGKNVGTGNWKIDMHPTRDQPLFQKICDELGLSPDTQKVSKKAWYGYGGAMGPAQFIPSTWVGYKDRVSKLTGNSPANPWNPTDAFMAAGLLLADSGAAKGGSAAERRAAVCYLAGCANSGKASYQFYGNDALKYADKYQANIDILKNN